MSNGNLSIGCAGAGILGSAIIRRLLESGFSVSVWNRDREKLSPLIDLGAIPVEAPSELAAAGDLVLTCVTAAAAVEAIVFGDDGVAASGGPQKLLIDMSTRRASRAPWRAVARIRGCCRSFFRRWRVRIFRWRERSPS